MKTSAIALLLTLALPAAAQQPALPRFHITPHQVASALAQQGLTLADDQVALPAALVASSPEPLLQVEAVHSANSLTQVRLACQMPSACLPFYAVLTLPADTNLNALAPALRAAAPRALPAPIAMHAGSHAFLVVDTGQMHIRVPVVSLQDGAVGAQIHVASPDHKQTWHATVLSPTLLTGSL